MKYVREHLGATHTKALIVPECGHNDRCVFTMDDVLPVLFPGQPMSQRSGDAHADVPATHLAA